MIPFNYHHLYYFYVIAKTGSVSLAAKELKLAQPTLSAQLKQFEAFLEKKLFERERKRLVLTDEGREVLEYAKMIFDLGREFMDYQGDKKTKGRIRVQIGIDPFVPKTIAYLLSRFLFKISSGVFVMMVEDSLPRLVSQLKDHRLDMVLCDQLPRQETDETLKPELLSKIPVYFCGHPKFRRVSKDFPASLNTVPLILPTSSSSLSEAVRAFLLEKKIEPHILGEIQDVEVVRRLVMEGAAIAPLNLLTITKAPASTPLAILGREKGVVFEERIYLISRNRKNPHPLVLPVAMKFKEEINTPRRNFSFRE